MVLSTPLGSGPLAFDLVFAQPWTEAHDSGCAALGYLLRDRPISEEICQD